MAGCGSTCWRFRLATTGGPAAHAPHATIPFRLSPRCCTPSRRLTALRRPPQAGNWADVSGETFLRKLLSMSVEQGRPNNVRCPACRSRPLPVAAGACGGAACVGRRLTRTRLVSRLQGKDAMFDCAGMVTVDPRSLAQRIMDVSCAPLLG